MLVKGIFTSISGSIGGTTASHNKGGQYLRARTIPTNPNTLAQQNARTSLTMANEAWSALAQDQRDLWNAYAQIQTWSNAMGDAIQLSGQQHFVGSYTVSMAAAQETPIEPPIPNTRPAAPQFVTPVYDGGTFNTNIGNPQGLLDKIIFGIGRAISPGQLYYKGPYTNVLIAPANAPTHLYDDPIQKPPGSKVSFRARFVMKDGRYSAFSEVLIPVA